MYDPADPARPYKMWWLGELPGVADLGVPGDRIYFSYSPTPDGPWSTPVVVLAPQLGQSGRDEADDHLLGSPAVLKFGDTYYMYYEAYGVWATAIQRFFSFEQGSTWTTNGTPQQELAADPSFVPDLGNPNLGIGLRYAKAETHPVYSGEITFNLPGGPKISRFLRRESIVTGPDGQGNVNRALNGNHPIFYLYDDEGPVAGERQQLYQFFDTQFFNHFATEDPAGEGVAGAVPDFGNHLLGYAAVDLSTQDMEYSLQNRIMLATSPDGVNWTRCDGNEKGNAIIVPRDKHVSEFNVLTGVAPNRPTNPNHPEYWDIHRYYGSGFPGALVRENSIELFLPTTPRRQVCSNGGCEFRWPNEMSPTPTRPQTMC
jgi:hypothetical protein